MSESTEKMKKQSEKESKLSERMRAEARNLGLCDEWYNAWGDASIEDMLGKLKKGFDFVLQHHWPSPAFMKEHAGVDILRDHNILCDDTWSLLNPKECFIMGKSSSTIRYNAQNFGVVWICGESVATITAKNKSHVIVELCDSAKVLIREVYPEARVTVIKHGNKCDVSSFDGVAYTVKEGERYDV